VKAFRDPIFTPEFEKVRVWLGGLVQNGLIKGTAKIIANGGDGSYNIEQVMITLTDEGKKYYESEDNEKLYIKTCEVYFGEISGIKIQEQFNVAEAKYTIGRRNPTPFGKKISQEPENRTAQFSLFDDGWRIDN
jgi:hypothetical protein